MTKPKILFLDIETAPAVAYIWRMFQENIGLDQLIEPSRIICFSAKWLHDKEIIFAAEWEIGKVAMLQQAHALMSEADAVVTYNGDKFDIPRLMGEFAEFGLQAPPPVASIDLIKTVRKLGLQSNRLAYVGPYLHIGRKIQNEGFRLWRKVLEGNEGARARMRRYNIQDTRMLQGLYKRLRPYIRNHPRLTERPGCPSCQSRHTQSRGNRYTRMFIIERRQCRSCGHWFDAARHKIGAKHRGSN